MYLYVDKDLSAYKAIKDLRYWRLALSPPPLSSLYKSNSWQQVYPRTIKIQKLKGLVNLQKVLLIKKAAV